MESGEIDGKITFVFSNREPHEAEGSDLFFELVRSYHIPVLCLSSKKFWSEVQTKDMTKDRAEQRIEYDRRAMELLKNFNPDICMLAGYMLIVGDEMCHRYNMINLHPALPNGPTGSWQDVVWKLIENKAEKSGAMIHLVTPELDRGPVITYCTYPIIGEPFDKYWREIEKLSAAEIKREQGEDNSLFRLIRQHGLSREFPLIVHTLKALSNNDIYIESGKIVNSHRKSIAGYDISFEVNEMKGAI